jgi:hypothetical protein
MKIVKIGGARTMMGENTVVLVGMAVLVIGAGIIGCPVLIV